MLYNKGGGRSGGEQIKKIKEFNLKNLLKKFHANRTGIGQK